MDHFSKREILKIAICRTAQAEPGGQCVPGQSPGTSQEVRFHAALEWKTKEVTYLLGSSCELARNVESNLDILRVSELLIPALCSASKRPSLQQDL